MFQKLIEKSFKMKATSKKSVIIPLISLFTSFGTLICCALPALLVTIGSGAVLAGLISNVPQLLILSKYKIFIFSIAGILIFIGGIVRWVNRNAPCPIDPVEAKLCSNIRIFTKYIYIASIILFLIGGFFVFIAPKLL